MELRRAPLGAAGVLVAFALVLAPSGCASRAGSKSVPAPPQPADVGPLAALGSELGRLLDTPPVRQAMWAVDVETLETGEHLFSLNNRQPATPASTVKIVTLSAAAERLGWDFRFETELLTAAPIVDNVLRGDVIVRGSGDDWPPRAFEDFAAALARAGVHTIDGRVGGDDNAFDEEGLPAGWMWDDLGYGFAAPAGALQFHENLVTLTIYPGQAPGASARIDVNPATSGLQIASDVTTAAAGNATDIVLRRLPGQLTLHLSGVVPAGSEPTYRTASVDNPTIFFAHAFRAALIESGIDIRGAAVDIDDAPELAGRDPRYLRRLALHHSPPVAELAKVLMRASRNVYAESLLKTLGGVADAHASSEAGLVAIGEVLMEWGVPAADYVLRDGSGLSRYDLMTPEALVVLLRRMHEDQRHRELFAATLPLAGSEGTLSARLRATRAHGNVRAKTGSMRGVWAIAGYLSTRDGETLAFAILANHFTISPSVIDKAIDDVLVRLADFSRQ